jgi:hypothetical protein
MLIPPKSNTLIPSSSQEAVSCGLRKSGVEAYLRLSSAEQQAALYACAQAVLLQAALQLEKHIKIKIKIYKITIYYRNKKK